MNYPHLSLFVKRVTHSQSQEMNKTSDNGGVNLVVFDADDDVDSRRSELLSWKEEHGVDFELFLLPDNHNPGELGDLLESIINPENKPVLDCWNPDFDIFFNSGKVISDFQTVS